YRSGAIANGWLRAPPTSTTNPAPSARTPENSSSWTRSPEGGSGRAAHGTVAPVAIVPPSRSRTRNGAGASASVTQTARLGPSGRYPTWLHRTGGRFTRPRLRPRRLGRRVARLGDDLHSAALLVQRMELCDEERVL